MTTTTQILVTFHGPAGTTSSVGTAASFDEGFAHAALLVSLAPAGTTSVYVIIDAGQDYYAGSSVIQSASEMVRVARANAVAA
jgi:hypothetical protein